MSWSNDSLTNLLIVTTSVKLKELKFLKSRSFFRYLPDFFKNDFSDFSRADCVGTRDHERNFQQLLHQMVNSTFFSLKIFGKSRYNLKLGIQFKANV